MRRSLSPASARRECRRERPLFDEPILAEREREDAVRHEADEGVARFFAIADELTEHFVAAASACAPLPFYVYEYAERSGYAIAVEVIDALRDRTANLVGMKVSDAPLDRAEPYLNLGLDVFIGAEPVIRAGLDRGAVGAVSGVAAAFPEAVAALVAEPTSERAALVESLRAVLGRLPFQAAVKTALRFRGVPVREDVRAPLRPTSPADVERLRAQLESLVDLEAAKLRI